MIRMDVRRVQPLFYVSAKGCQERGPGVPDFALFQSQNTFVALLVLVPINYDYRK